MFRYYYPNENVEGGFGFSEFPSDEYLSYFTGSYRHRCTALELVPFD
jgi:hypothetical protein